MWTVRIDDSNGEAKYLVNSTSERAAVAKVLKGHYPEGVMANPVTIKTEQAQEGLIKE